MCLCAPLFIDFFWSDCDVSVLSGDQYSEVNVDEPELIDEE
jgi:hypothetical protein